MSENNNRRTAPGTSRQGAGQGGYSGRASYGNERAAGGKNTSGRQAEGRSGRAGESQNRQPSSGRAAGAGASSGRVPGSGASSARTVSGAPRGSSGRQSSSDRILAVQNARNLGSGNARSGSGASRNGYGNRKRGRKRRQGPDIAKILLLVIGAIILLICVGVGVRSCSKNGGDAGQAAGETETSETETELTAEITVNGVSVNGLTKSEAKDKVMASIGWGMKVSYEGEAKELPDMMESKVEEVLDEAYSKKEAAEYQVSADGLEDQIKTAAEQIASGWDVPAKNGAISSYDKESGQFVFSSEESGRLINRDKLADDIKKALGAGEYQKTIEASADVVAPEITKEQAKAQFKRIGTFTTTTTSNKDRNENIRLASNALNGIILQPGEEFSMNTATGARTTEKGYKPAGAYLNGVLIEEPGGGVCQVSSTLYNAVVFSGLQTTERHPHSFEPSYVTPGEDAMISYGSADMKFKNNSKSAVGIKTSFSNQKLTISIYGVPVLAEGESLEMKSEKIKELDPPKPEYEEDPTMELGIEKVVKQPVMGSRWVTNLVKKKDGQVVSDEFLHNSTYLGKPATIRRNTSGSVLTTEGSEAETTTAAPSESAAEGGSVTAPPAETMPAASHGAEQGPGSGYGPGYESTQSTVNTGEGPGTNIRPSSPADMATTAATEPGPVSIPQTAPQQIPQTAPQTQAVSQENPGSNVISPNPANPG